MNLSFDEWVKFTFDHPVTDPAWYWSDSWDEFWDAWSEGFAPEQQLRYATQLFQGASVLLIGTYSIEQINQGLTMLLSGPTDFRIADLIWSRQLSLPVREGCIASMVRLFQSVFSRVVVEHACFMWWDELREWDHQEDRDPRSKEAILTALELILNLPSRDCQMSALHGLGHLRHPDKEKIIRGYVQRHSELDEEIREYAQAAIEGTVL